MSLPVELSVLRKMAGVFEVEVDGVEHDHGHGHGHRDDAAQVGEQHDTFVDEAVKSTIIEQTRRSPAVD